jgi:membrane-associated phospholipid phosphatase
MNAGYVRRVPRRAAIPLLTAALCGGFALVVWAIAFHTDAGMRADYRVLEVFGLTDESRAWVPLDRLAKTCNPTPYAVLSLVVLVWTYATRGVRGVLVALVILAGANVLTQTLKDLLADPRTSPVGRIGATAWPSGHSTAAAALAACAVLAARPPYRALVAVLAGVFVAGVSGAVVLLGWHFPSDALGGYAVAGLVASLAIAADRLTPRGRPARAPAPPRAARQAAR